MQFLNKFLMRIEENPTIFKNPKMNYLFGLTTSTIKELKKYALLNGLIEQRKQEYHMTEEGKIYLKNNPVISWCEGFTKRPELNLEYLKEEKTPATVTKAIRNLAKYLLDGEELKENSMEEYIYEELLGEISTFKDLSKELEDCFSCAKRTNLEEIFNKFSDYGLTKSIISVLLLGVLSKNKDCFAIYEKFQFQLKINQLLFDKMIFMPQNFEIQKTEITNNPILSDISTFILPKKSENILEITKGLMQFFNGLDKYTIQTERLSSRAIKLRNAILNAKDPINLITIDIPRIIQGKRLNDCDAAFVEIFKETLFELKDATNKMVQEINNFTLNAFNVENRTELKERFKSIEQYIGSKELKTLYTNVINNAPDKFWIERIATFINKSRVPKDWTDEDVADFKVKIKELALKIHTIEATVGSNENTTSANFYTVLNGLLKLSKSEQFMILRKAVNG